MGHTHRHNHDHNHSHNHEHPIHSHLDHLRALFRAILITLVFMGIEWTGGIWSNSLALISDSFHMLGDLASLALSAAVILLARKKASAQMTYGYRRLEVLGSWLSALGIWAIAAFLMKESLDRYFNPQEVKAQGVIVVSILGLAANLFAMRALHNSAHDHLNVRAAYLHVVSDALGSVGALVSGIILWKTGWREVDPLISFGVATLMMVSSWGLLREGFNLLLEAAPRHIEPEEVRSKLIHLMGVVEIHDLHIWQIASGQTALSAHLVMGAHAKSNELLKTATEMLVNQFKISHSTLQIELEGQIPSERCHDCDHR